MNAAFRVVVNQVVLHLNRKRSNVIASRTWSCILAAVVIGTLTLIGCTHNVYEIEMKPDGEVMERKFTAWKTGGDGEDKIQPLAREELERIAAAYEQAAQDNVEGAASFSGKFDGRLPRDVGGHGSFVRYETRMGSLSIYVERFRGSDDLQKDLSARQKAIDRAVELIIGWLELEAGKDVRFANLKTFLDESFRRDVQNMSLYSWIYTIAAQRDESASSDTATYVNDHKQEAAVRFGQYLLERGYFTAHSWPQVMRAFDEMTQEKPERLLLLVQRLAAKKMGVAEDEPIPASLEFLADAEKVQTSLDDFLRGTDEYARMLKEWEQAKIEDPDREMPQPIAVLQQYVIEGFLPGTSFGPPDRLTIKLSNRQKPYWTNGTWDEENNRVTWTASIGSRDRLQGEWPTLCYAFNSAPNVMYQETHFGKVVLEGENLGEYCLWRQALSAHESDEWDAFVASLLPEKGVERRLATFHFSHEPADVVNIEEGRDESLAAEPRRMLLDAIQPDDPPNE